MKLERVLENLNSFQKRPLTKLLEEIVEQGSDTIRAKVEEILALETSSLLKSAADHSIARVFNLISDEYGRRLSNNLDQLNYLHSLSIDILSRDGNCIMKRDWFSALYDIEFRSLEKQVLTFEEVIKKDTDNDLDQQFRDYRLYRNCLHTAFFNDEKNNQDRKISSDEKSILLTLSEGLGLSRERVRTVHHSVLALKKPDILQIINDLKDAGILFYSQKSDTVYVPDEFVKILRKLTGREVADRFFRRVLNHLTDSELNMVSKQHNLSTRGLSREERIKQILTGGLGFSRVLLRDLHSDQASKTDKKNFLNELIVKRLQLTDSSKGATAEDKVKLLINTFEHEESEENISIAESGYEKLLRDLSIRVPLLNEKLRAELDLKEEKVLFHHYLLDFNIKPEDILYMLSTEELRAFCKESGIKSRGNLIANVIEAYKDSESLYLENYINIAFRDLNALKQNNLVLKESECGAQFELLTAKLFEELGFTISNEIKKDIQDKKNIADIVIDYEPEQKQIIIIECKTKKDKAFDRFSNVSRQIKAYRDRAKAKGYIVSKCLLVAPEFSDEFVKDCSYDPELNLSLIKAKTLLEIRKALHESKLNKLPAPLLMRDVLIEEGRILGALQR